MEQVIMRFKLKDIDPNPFRHMERYPIRRDKVEALKASIGQTTFWDNIVARKVGDRAEIAYGHHRLVTLREIYPPDHEVNLIVRKLDNATMIQVMANENMEEWGSTASVAQETVRAVVEAYAAGQIELEAPGHTANVRHAPSFKVGQSAESADCPYNAETITRFLGWNSPHRVLTALAELEAQELQIVTEADMRRMAGDKVSRQDIDTVVRTARRTYQAEKKKTGSEGKAREKAQKVSSRLAGLAAKGKLTPDNAPYEARKAAGSNGKKGPPPQIDDVAKKMMRKLERFLSDEDADWPWVDELFRFAAYINADYRADLARDITRLQEVLNILADGLRRGSEVDEPAELKVFTPQQRKLLEVHDG